ncbi:MAG: hypothetical protein ABI723_16180 [Bacteroidia bacterium]
MEKVSKEFFRINGLVAVLLDKDEGWQHQYLLYIGNTNFSMEVIANYKNENDKIAVRKTLLSIYPDTMFRKKYPKEEFTPMKYFPLCDSDLVFSQEARNEIWGSEYRCKIDSTLNITGYQHYYNMFTDFDDFVSFWSSDFFNREEKDLKIKNIKIRKQKKGGILEYDEVYNGGITYHACIAHNFRMLFITGASINAKNSNIKIENHVAAKKKFQKFIQEIVID